MRNKPWLPMLLTAVVAAQVFIWFVIVNITMERVDAGMRERLPMIAAALREDAMCVELHSERSLPGGSSFFLLGPGESGSATHDTITDYRVVSSKRLAAVRLNEIPLDLPCVVDIDLRFRFMMPRGSVVDTAAKDLREQLASDLSTALWTQKGGYRLKLLDTVLLANLVSQRLLEPPLHEAQYAVVDTVAGRVLHASAGADLPSVLRSGYRQPVFLRDQLGMPLALCVLFPGERASIMLGELPWLLGLLLLVGALLFGVRQYVRTAQEQRKLACMQMDLVSNITHEFNTPISNIALALDTLKKRSTSGSRISNDQLWDIIQVENKRLHANIRKVLDVSMLEGRQLLMEPELHDVHEVLNGAADCFKPAIARNGARLEKQFLAERSWARVDATYLGNVFQVLIDNAIKYGGSEVHIILRTEDRADGVLVEVSDNGPGILPKEREMIFEKFYRVRRSDRYAVKGTGIGLYYARQVVEAHSGWIRVDDQWTKGSRFVVYIPIEGSSHVALARS